GRGAHRHRRMGDSSDEGATRMSTDNVSNKLSLAPVRPEDAGEVLTVQRAAFVSEALIYDNVNMPPLTQTLEQVRAELTENSGWVARLGGRLVGVLRAVEDGDALL